MITLFHRIFLVTLLTLPVIGLSAQNCFIISDGSAKILSQQGNCITRVTPASTFKIPLALMGFDSGILISPSQPVWQYKPEYPAYLPSWKHSQTPRSWIENSVVWYSQILTQKLGAKDFQKYVDLFNYGNKDLSGDFGKNNGLTQAWLGSSLTISPLEQVIFLKNMLNHQWKLSPTAYTYTKNILHKGILIDDWQFYGKTGTAAPIGWFVGWIQKGDKIYVFAYLREDEDQSAEPQRRMETRVLDVKTQLVEFLKNHP